MHGTSRAPSPTRLDGCARCDGMRVATVCALRRYARWLPFAVAVCLAASLSQGVLRRLDSSLTEGAILPLTNVRRRMPPSAREVSPQATVGGCKRAVAAEHGNSGECFVSWDVRWLPFAVAVCLAASLSQGVLRRLDSSLTEGAILPLTNVRRRMPPSAREVSPQATEGGSK